MAIATDLISGVPRRNKGAGGGNGQLNNSDGLGWVGFSEPFTIPKGAVEEFPRQLQKQAFLLVFCLAACLVGVVGPGIALRGYLPRMKSSVWLPVPGILMLSVIGLFVWLTPEQWDPAVVSRVGLSTLFLCVGGSLVRWPITSVLSKAEMRVLAIIVLLAAIAVAKSSYSIGPSDELYRGLNSRSLEAGTRSDSRISYHVMHLIGVRQGGNSQLGADLFSPWSFSHRGPIAALAAAPFALCGNVKLPKAQPEIAWTVFDSQGFAAYRVSMIVLAAGSLFVVFGLAKVFLGEQWAMLAFLVVAAAPFTIHELFFTWPKSLAASFVLLAAYLVLKKRYFAAGFAAGAGYLCHPSALLCFPSILAMALIGIIGESGLFKQKLIGSVTSVGKVLAGLAVWMAMWRLINLNNFHQDGFFNYVRHTVPYNDFTIFHWLSSRWINLNMTLVPLNAYLYHRFDTEMLSPDKAPQPWVQFLHQYWSTLPFAVGIVFYAALAWLAAYGFVKARAWMWFVIVLPIGLFLIYWGEGNTGLLREGLHGWVFGLLLFGVVMWRRYLSASGGFWIFTTLALAIRGVETGLMLIPFSSWSRGYALQRPYEISDLIGLAIMAGGTALLTWTVVSQCWLLRRASLHPVENCD